MKEKQRQSIRLSINWQAVNNLWRYIGGAFAVSFQCGRFFSYGDYQIRAYRIFKPGDQICYTYVNLEKLVQMGCQVIVCACRKRNPDTFNAVAKVAWEYDFRLFGLSLIDRKMFLKTNIRMNYPTRYSTYSNSAIISTSGCFADKEPNDLLMVFSMNEV